MSYSFVKQVNHARSFLEGAKFYDRDERARMSLDCLGVDESLHFLGADQSFANILKDVGPGAPDGHLEDHSVASILAGQLLKISASYVSQVFHSKAPRF